MSSNLGRIPPLTLELAALERLKKKRHIVLLALYRLHFIGSSTSLQVTRTTIISRTSFNFGQIRPRTAELAALELLKKFLWTYNGENFVTTLDPSFLIGSSSLLQITRTTIKAWMSSNLGRIPPLTLELAALERLKKRHIILLAL